MSPRGHRSTGALLGLAQCWYWLDTPGWNALPGAAAGAFAGTLHAALTGAGSGMPAAAAGLAFLAGAMAGARAPDWLEIASWTPSGERRPVIPHRTLTHWPWLWFAALAGGALLAWMADGPITRLAAMAFAGFAASGLLHLAMDIMTPSGIPLAHPFGPHSSLNVYRSGSPKELLVIAATGAAAFGSAWIANNAAAWTGGAASISLAILAAGRWRARQSRSEVA